jgi:hypothetical protein
MAIAGERGAVWLGLVEHERVIGDRGWRIICLVIGGIMCRDWPNPDENIGCSSPAQSKEPEPVLRRRGKRRRKDVGAV